jgi:Na+-transporting NADH:ubiquinone oxidoreductase subunit B
VPAAGPLGGLTAYLPDAVTGATPGVLMKAGRAGEVSLLSLVFGNVAGTVGGTSALLALLGGLYLCFTKTANFRIPLAGLVSAFVVSGALHLGGVPKAADPLREILASNVVFGLFYFATEPVSAPKTQVARWIYGAFIGAMAQLITVFSAWPAGTMFAILLANMFAPITDHAVKAVKARGKAPAKA